MKYFVDTEFVFHEPTGHVTPLSIALVREDGKSYYTVFTDAFMLPPVIPSFVRTAVLPVLFKAVSPDTKNGPGPMARSAVAVRIKDFIGGDTPEFWGDYAAFDYVVLSIIMGGFGEWPEGWPMFINDFQQLGMQTLPSYIPHNALSDAIALFETWKQNEVPS